MPTAPLIRTSAGWRDLAVTIPKAELTTWQFAEYDMPLAVETMGSSSGNWIYRLSDDFEFMQEEGTGLVMDGFCTVNIQQNFHGCSAYIAPGFAAAGFGGYWPAASGRPEETRGWYFSSTMVGTWFGGHAATIPLQVAMKPDVGMGPWSSAPKVPCIFFEHVHSTIQLFSVNYSVRRIANLQEN